MHGDFVITRAVSKEDVETMEDQGRPSIKSELFSAKRSHSEGLWQKSSPCLQERGTQQARDIEPVLGQCWADVVDGGPTSTQHWFNVPCLQGSHRQFNLCQIKNNAYFHPRDHFGWVKIRLFVEFDPYSVCKNGEVAGHSSADQLPIENTLEAPVRSLRHWTV